MKLAALYQILFLLCSFAPAFGQDAEKDPELEKIQGVWVRLVKDTDGNVITITKEVSGKKETFRAMRGDELLQEHIVDFEIKKTDNVRIFTYRNLTVTGGTNIGREQKAPVSYIYKVTDTNWYCIQGAMVGDKDGFQIEAYQRAEDRAPKNDPGI